jgi:hypothetical protein
MFRMSDHKSNIGWHVLLKGKIFNKWSIIGLSTLQKIWARKNIYKRSTHPCMQCICCQSYIFVGLSKFTMASFCLVFWDLATLMADGRYEPRWIICCHRAKVSRAAFKVPKTIANLNPPPELDRVLSFFLYFRRVRPCPLLPWAMHVRDKKNLFVQLHPRSGLSVLLYYKEVTIG